MAAPGQPWIIARAKWEQLQFSPGAGIPTLPSPDTSRQPLPHTEVELKETKPEYLYLWSGRWGDSQ